MMWALAGGPVRRVALAGLVGVAAACGPQAPREVPAQELAETSEVPLVRVAGSPLNPFVRAEVNGKPGLFLVDTGATVTCLDSRFADGLGLRQRGIAPERIRTNVTGEIKTARVGGMRLGRHHFNAFTAAVLRLGHLEEGLGHKVDGVIGMNVLRGARFGFSPSPPRFTFGHPGLAAAAVPIELTGNAMYINATIQGVAVRMKIDTGANRTVMGTADFARVMEAGAAVTAVRQERAVDVNGITRNAMVRVLRGRMRAGNLERDGFAVYEGVGNLLGMDFFLDHEMVFDAARGQAWFQPCKGKASQGRN